ncbi:MAG TPA: substrate-binding domain-containing protein [Urbifossiella sp.]|nr:substrate-binding domain-containing protein [Urbifossiella sp.]
MNAAMPLPKYLDLASSIEVLIQKGHWEGKIPSVRWVAQQHKVSAVTASRALQVLRDKGLIRTIERSGNFRMPPPEVDRWALVLRPTPGPWQAATQEVTRAGFEALARRVPQHVETDLFPLVVGMTPPEIWPLVRTAKQRGIRGAFLLPSRCSDAEMRLDECFLTCCREEQLPVVLLERNLRGQHRALEHDLVAVDDLYGAAACTRHLLDLGRKRIAAIVASPTSSHNDRVAGYLYALHSAAQPSGKRTGDYKAFVLQQSDDLPNRDSYAKLAAQVRKHGIDGVICYVDYLAVGLMVELLAHGIAVPGDVAVVGFDDLPIGNWFPIGVTTYSYPSEAMAEQAVRLMHERIANPDRPAVKAVVPGQLIIRESSAGKN